MHAQKSTQSPVAWARPKLFTQGDDKALESIPFSWTRTLSLADRAEWAVRTASGAFNVLRAIPVAEWDGIYAGTTTTDLSPYINDALTTAKHVYMPEGLFTIGNPISLPTQRQFTGAGIATRIKALAALAGVAKPAITAATYAPTLDKVPMVYNPSTTQWFSIRDLWLDGDDKDVYGLWLMENFYGLISNVRILNTGSRPYTNIRGQSVTHEEFTCYSCGSGVVLYDNTNLSFKGGGFERLSASWYVDQRQPSAFSKGGVNFEDVWFESDATHRPTNGFLKLSGRRNRADIHAAYDTGATTEQHVSFSDNADSRTFDSLVTTNANCYGAKVRVNNSTGAMYSIAAPNSAYNRLEGFYTLSKVTDNGIANQWDANGSLATPVTHVTNRFQVRSPLSTTAADYVFDAQWNGGTPFLYMLKSTTKYFDLNGANWRMTSGAGLDFVANAGASAINYTGSAYVFNGSSGAAGYTKPVYVGTYALWVDSAGKLRIKSSAPTTDLDGTVVGTQT